VKRRASSPVPSQTGTSRSRLIRLHPRRATFWITALCVLLLAACATKPRIDWNTRVGSYTHDQAVLELGPPDKEAKLSDGTTVAEWVLSRSVQTRPYVFYHSGAYWGPRYGNYVGWAYDSGPLYTTDWFLRLTFNPSGILSEWKRSNR
jgi:hypothetical protein